ncbi:MAG: outer membrane lipoprotein-sorting protein [Bacteriovoracaceae bacterium]|nr:outer membrane lipoprotein-sorting protein [Bacteriovoracaceae bacterium]
MLKHIFFLSLVSSLYAATEPAQRGLEIARQVEAKDNGWGDQQVQAKMILRSPNEKEVVRVIRTKSLEVTGDGDKALIVFDQPLDVKGTVFLTYAHKQNEDEQWLYLPALNRVKRISASNRSGPFMGSEFAYEDVGSQEVEQFTYQYLRDEKFDNTDCFVVERYPTQSSSGYKRQIVWVDKANTRLQKIEYYDLKDKLLKTLVFKKYQLYAGKFWRSLLWEMTNHQTQKSTNIEWDTFKLKVGLNANDFDQNALKRVK